MHPWLVPFLQVFFALLNALALLGLTAHFWSEAHARESARRLYERYALLRLALVLALSGVIVVAEADALRALGRLAPGTTSFHLAQAIGYALSLGGLLLLHVVLLTPHRGLDPRVARRLAFRERVRAGGP